MENFDELLNEINETIDEINEEVLIHKGRQFLLNATLYYQQKCNIKNKTKIATFICMLLRAYNSKYLPQPIQSIDE